MRRIFALVFMATATLAVVIGVAVAWTSSATGSGFTASAGGLNVALDFSNPGYGYTGNQVYPTGSPIEVIKGQIKNNTPANPGVNVWATSGTITGITPSNGGCNAGAAISGDVVINNNDYVAPGAIGDIWTGRMTMLNTANDSCQNNTLTYTVTVNVST